MLNVEFSHFQMFNLKCMQNKNKLCGCLVVVVFNFKRFKHCCRYIVVVVIRCAVTCGVVVLFV
jgi:hypothetical protein